MGGGGQMSRRVHTGNKEVNHTLSLSSWLEPSDDESVSLDEESDEEEEDW